MTLLPRNIKIVHLNSESVFTEADVVIGVCLHNQKNMLNKCLNSIFDQKMYGIKIAIVILDDQSSDNWEEHVEDIILRKEIVIINGNCGNASRARNALLDFVDENFPRAKWVARLDADDKFSCQYSLYSSCIKGSFTNSKYVIGGNVLVNNELIYKNNPASRRLMDEGFVLSILESMAAGSAINELPSCNLLLATHSGWRYPDIRSAEDHWLVANLLLNHKHCGAILEYPYYCDYNLNGAETGYNILNSLHTLSRKKLYNAAATWIFAKSMDGKFLGHGQEGAVCQIDGHIKKYFYPAAISNSDIADLTGMLVEAAPFLPSPEWAFDKGRFVASYPYFPTEPANEITLEQAHEFLMFCLTKGLVCKNIKRENFRITPEGKLFMVDIGKDIIAMRADYFRDSAARLYALVLGYPDGEFLQRESERNQEDILTELSGFKEFYHNLMMSYASIQWSKSPCADPIELPKIENITLLIKCCAMDAEFIDIQVRYIVYLLSKPRKFKEVLLLIDPYLGPYLRQHCVGNIELLMNKATNLVNKKIVDRLLIAPSNSSTIQGINLRWFNLISAESRTYQDAPVVSHLWGFEQITSRYVLQCDVDILVGRRDLEHDFLFEMIDACSNQKDALGVAFNIPHPDGMQNPYDASSGEYVPEVRCGLLDLQRIKSCLPLPNSASNKGICLTWHRSLEMFQKINSLRTLRGGDARTFYIHPENHWKRDPDSLFSIIDIVAQGNIPQWQMKKWDLKGEKKDWAYPYRNEDIVFLIKGRNTPIDKIKRCISSIKMQNDQDFGLIIIDDASDITDTTLLQHYIRPFETRATLIRRSESRGRIPNFITGITDICINSETLVVVLDLDDALIDPKTVSKLREKWMAGHDVILGGMFRHDKPLKLYSPDFDNARMKWGGDVWIHLRSFRKRLFDAIPEDALKIDGEWIAECTDYATMIPIVELASSPVFIQEYLYYHEPTTIRTSDIRLRKECLIKSIISKKSLK